MFSFCKEFISAVQRKILSFQGNGFQRKSSFFLSSHYLIFKMLTLFSAIYKDNKSTITCVVCWYSDKICLLAYFHQMSFYRKTLHRADKCSIDVSMCIDVSMSRSIDVSVTEFFQKRNIFIGYKNTLFSPTKDKNARF